MDNLPVPSEPCPLEELQSAVKEREETIKKRSADLNRQLKEIRGEGEPGAIGGREEPFCRPNRYSRRRSWEPAPGIIALSQVLGEKETIKKRSGYLFSSKLALG